MKYLIFTTFISLMYNLNLLKNTKKNHIFILNLFLLKKENLLNFKFINILFINLFKYQFID